MHRKLKKVRSRLHYFRTEVFAISLTICIVSFLYVATSVRDAHTRNIFAYTSNDLYIKILHFDKLSDPAFHFALGNHYFSNGAKYDIEKAKKHYINTLKIDKNFPLANYQLARVYFVSNDQKKALEYIDRELMYYPEFKRSYYIRGLINGYSDNLPAAVEDFKAFLAWKPESWAGHNDLAWVYFQQGDYASAYEIAADGLRYSPGNPWLLNSVGVALQNLNDKEAAKKAYNDSLARIETLTPESWGKAYPGNDPGFYKTGFENMKQTVTENLALVTSGE